MSKRNKYSKPNYVITQEGKVRLLSDWITPYGTVKAPLETNGADVPKGLRWLIKPLGCLLIPSIFHDYYYVKALVNKAYADWSFMQIGLDFNVSKFIIYPAYFLVKLFGKGNY